MFPASAFGVGVTVAELEPVVPDDEVVLPRGVVARPSRLGELLRVDLMTPEQKVAQLQRVQDAEAVLAAYRAELVVGLATDRPAGDDRRQGQAGAASGEWAAQLLDEDESEFFPGRAGPGPQLLASGGDAALLVRPGTAGARSPGAAGAGVRRAPAAVHRPHDHEPARPAGHAGPGPPAGVRAPAGTRARGRRGRRGAGPERPAGGRRRAVGDRPERRAGEWRRCRR